MSCQSLSAVQSQAGDVASGVSIILPCHNFTGPGTKLDKRLNADGTPKRWSKPVNRVDDAAYRHDLAYAGTANRIETDRKMIKELDDISNPTLRERIERGVVRPILKAKVDFGI